MLASLSSGCDDSAHVGFGSTPPGSTRVFYVAILRAARMRPTPRLKTAAARKPAPTYASPIRPLGSFASGEATDRKNAAGIRIAAIGAPVRAIHFQNGERSASST